MKINPVGVQAYQQISQRNQNQSVPAEKNKPEPKDVTLNISPQNPQERSELAIKAPGKSYAEFLTPEEKAALDLLFSRYSNAERFGSGYKSRVEDNDTSKSLGRFVDVKV